MKARLHHDLAEFTALTRPLLEADPIRHSIALTVLALLSRVPEVAASPPVLLSVHREGVLAGAAVRTPPHDLIVSGLPAEYAGAVVEVLVPSYQGLPGTVGPRSEGEPSLQCDLPADRLPSDA
ncbi:MAG: hypothetical protein JO309_08965 [Pseudonocardiales bacterium]|nr:hypothetical protein [Pseudonocardiales bacterium]MBV9729517.1 hypothetical protein [Pseudonocardiales bacterium]